MAWVLQLLANHLSVNGIDYKIIKLNVSTSFLEYVAGSKLRLKRNDCCNIDLVEKEWTQNGSVALKPTEISLFVLCRSRTLLIRIVP